MHTFCAIHSAYFEVLKCILKSKKVTFLVLQLPSPVYNYLKFTFNIKSLKILKNNPQPYIFVTKTMKFCRSTTYAGNPNPICLLKEIYKNNKKIKYT